MPIKRWLAMGACVVLSPMAMADTAASVASGFSGGAEGWSAQNGALAFQWSPLGGVRTGYVSAIDDPNAGGALWFFSAPARFLGDQSAMYGGTLAFSLESSSSSAPNTTPTANIQLLGSNGVLLTFGGGGIPAASWTQYVVPLSANGTWTIGSLGGAAATEQDMLGVLGSLKALRINGDYYKGVEKTGLDSVALAAAPVPEPAAAWMWLAGAGILTAAVRRRGTR